MVSGYDQVPVAQQLGFKEYAYINQLRPLSWDEQVELALLAGFAAIHYPIVNGIDGVLWSINF